MRPVSHAEVFQELPFLAADSARIAQPQGRATGLIYQNIDPPYQYPNVDAAVQPRTIQFAVKLEF